MYAYDIDRFGCTPFPAISLESYISGRGTARADNTQGTPTQIHISPSILVYEDKKVIWGEAGRERVRMEQSHVETLIIHKLGFNQNHYTFTLILLMNIVMCRKFP